MAGVGLRFSRRPQQVGYEEDQQYGRRVWRVTALLRHQKDRSFALAILCRMTHFTKRRKVSADGDPSRKNWLVSGDRHHRMFVAIPRPRGSMPV